MSSKRNTLSLTAIEGQLLPEEETYQAKLREAVSPDGRRHCHPVRLAPIRHGTPRAYYGDAERGGDRGACSSDGRRDCRRA